MPVSLFLVKKLQASGNRLSGRSFLELSDEIADIGPGPLENVLQGFFHFRQIASIRAVSDFQRIMPFSVGR
jgi:hypothetical protein